MEYISREAVNNIIEDMRNNHFILMCERVNLSVLKSKVAEIPAADVQTVVDTENTATVSDEFICKKCGIYLKDYIKVVMDEDNDGYIDEQHYDYEPKYCPECGAKVKDGDVK